VRALVIGSSSGIGLAVARRLVERGWEVVGVARRAAGFEAAGYTHVVGDVRDADFGARLAPHADADLVVYASGTGELLDPAQPAHEVDTFATNLVGLARTVEAVLPRMVAAGRGHLIGISSLADTLIDSQAPAYSASKAGMSAYLEGLALAVRRHGVAITNVRLGFVDTAMAKATGPKPFLVPAERIATLVEKAIRKRPIRVTFPWRMAALVWLVNLVPRARVWLS
jgi:short-subunit dehydrogenase